MRILLGLWLFLSLSGVAVAFPEMTRLGYANCSTCHVSPNGGGVLTPYGKGAAEDILSTWSRDGEARPAEGLLTEPESLTTGGHVRYLYADQDKQAVDFLMQADVEGAYEPIKNLWLVGSAGVYGPTHSREFRENYVLVQLNPDTSVRAGRFLRSYGLNVADHTTLVRSALGMGEGQETYNAELANHGPNGEVSLTQVVGSDGLLQGTQNDGYVYSTKSETAMVLRAAAYLGEQSQLGFSVMRGSGAEQNRTLGNLFGVVGLTDAVYALGEADVQRIDGESPRYLSSEMVGWEAVKGLHLQLLHEGYWDDPHPTFGGAVDWFPRPHLEATLKARWSLDHTEAFFLIHYYL